MARLACAHDISKERPASRAFMLGTRGGSRVQPVPVSLEPVTEYQVRREHVDGAVVGADRVVGQRCPDEGMVVDEHDAAAEIVRAMCSAADGEQVVEPD